VAPVATAADLARAFPPPTSGSARPVVLAPLAELAGDDLACGLRARGYRVDRVDAYRLEDPPADLAHGGPGVTGEALAGSDAVLFSAPSVVDRYLRHFGPESVPPLVVCIGPRTADRARSRGLEPVVVAAEHTTAGLLVAVQACLARAGNG
jgi:uroporphyrinogen-III synthase